MAWVSKKAKEREGKGQLDETEDGLVKEERLTWIPRPKAMTMKGRERTTWTSPEMDGGKRKRGEVSRVSSTSNRTERRVRNSQ